MYSCSLHLSPPGSPPSDQASLPIKQTHTPNCVTSLVVSLERLHKSPRLQHSCRERSNRVTHWLSLPLPTGTRSIHFKFWPQGWITAGVTSGFDPTRQSLYSDLHHRIALRITSRDLASSLAMQLPQPCLQLRNQAIPVLDGLQ
eukprot:386260-Amphidinium_carterae.1